MKKKIFLVVFTVLAIACSQSNEINYSVNDINNCTGHAVGIIGCYDVNKEYQLGVFIVTNNKDSLLSFNEAECFYDYIENNMTGGPYVRISNISRTFQYTYLEPNDTIQWITPLSNTMELALSNIDNFKQVKITQILK